MTKWIRPQTFLTSIIITLIVSSTKVIHDFVRIEIFDWKTVIGVPNYITKKHS